MTLETLDVVQYRALIEDLVSRMQKRGIDCMEWKHGESYPTVLRAVSAGITGNMPGNGISLSYACMLNGKGLLRWVVVDECCLIVTSSLWRPKLAGNVEESAAAAVPNSIAYGNASARAGGRNGIKKVGSVCNVHPSERGAAEHSILCVVSWYKRGKTQETALL
ncbi:hypothetical protein P153DRAFT_387576 [Dothidotthia symphoricarpi CBS 119687]|uniref:Uncharacterized protein n=1 Tax=Dothidotthia symphoricarpi CBS 119687 TaxID=1392245 RepID=A0A6A6AAF3_9PLEO|nr:uncharacterized protein P153DRAFT_387576 [Dothidotthia symphoricarpi CBS 119687]KAF2127848.1 hypothetical protein P153DRAFT_387576 [Dothidotthia symphoricarpi CBS 119687]